ncbi:MAG: tetratricopeptide repeat protein [Saprospirales bacterium]|nr:tetratricopeptide repeat protein [Saprospirales bacterium]
MAKRKSSPSAADAQVEVQEVKTTAAPFWEKNQNLLLYGLGALALIVLGWWGYKVLVAEPQQEEAVGAMWQAQVQFDRDSFKLALENPGGGYDGFLGIIDKYGSSKAGNIAHYYAGICYLQMGDFDNAINQLEDFDASGDLMPIMKNGVLGDCHSEKKEFDKALDYYGKAASSGKNDLLAAYYLKKLGMLYEHEGNKEAAREAFERLRRDFPNPSSPDWRDIEKYIYRAGAASK